MNKPIKGDNDASTDKMLREISQMKLKIELKGGDNDSNMDSLDDQPQNQAIGATSDFGESEKARRKAPIANGEDIGDESEDEVCRRKRKVRVLMDESE